MRIVPISEGNPMEFAIVGRLDTNTSPQLVQFADGLYVHGVRDVIVDMSKCDYVASAGLRAIVALQKRAAVGGSLVLRDVKPEVMETFKMTGFDKILEFA